MRVPFRFTADQNRWSLFPQWMLYEAAVMKLVDESQPDAKCIESYTSLAVQTVSIAV